MYKAKIKVRKTGETLWRNYKWKQPHEIEAIARRNGWVIVCLSREV